ncbi:MAG: type IVB secretion system lipoprotein DotD [Gammaproteobacteria bacterium]|nr:type IVB secretion system lipoprotein DotD [Gammaproteobacteria bacterium]
MNQKSLFVFTVITSNLLFLAGCAKTPQTQELPESMTTEPYVVLAESATSVSQSLTQLKATEQAANPPISVAEPPSPDTYGMGMPTSIDWNGPIEPLIKQIAIITNYTVRTEGKTPSLPIIINVSAKDTPVGEILRDISYQCGDRAQIVVFPSTHVIELRYAQA